MDMHVIDDDTMRDLIRFVHAHHTFARHNRVFRQHILEFEVHLQKVIDLEHERTAYIAKVKALEARYVQESIAETLRQWAEERATAAKPGRKKAKSKA